MKRAGQRIENAPPSRPLHTAVSGLVLRRLEHGDAPRLYALVSRNIAHLTVHGDYLGLTAMSVDALAAELAQADKALRFGIFLEEKLVGRIDLIGVEPPCYSVGYWLCASETGRGHASAALQAVIAYARSGLDATDLYAGVTHGNGPSERLLLRAGFTPAARFETYTRFHLGLGCDRLGPSS